MQMLIDFDEIAKLSPIATAITAAVGVYIAKKNLDRWRVETVGKRKAELAEQALIAFYEARDVFKMVRSRGIFGNEGSSRAPAPNEDSEQQKRRNTYYVPIERLVREKEVFARLQTLRYAFAAHFGKELEKPFKKLWEIHGSIMSSATVLIQLTTGDDEGDTRSNCEQLLNKLGWGPADRPDEIDQQVDQAIAEIEAVCRPVLSGKPDETTVRH